MHDEWRRLFAKDDSRKSGAGHFVLMRNVKTPRQAFSTSHRILPASEAINWMTDFLTRDLRAEDFVVDFAGAEEREDVDAPHFVEAHDAAETGLGEQGVGGGKLDVGGGEEDDFPALFRFDSLD